MKPDLTEIITTLMQSYDEYDEEYIVKAIQSLKTNWPNLTVNERTEIDAVAKAFEIMAIDEEDEEEIYDAKEDLFANTNLDASSYSQGNDTPQKRGLFRRK